ncbi:MAG: hypothetical protein Q8L27_04655 [archaeon]|nr:hypothetical protein [archaeon]
MSVEEVLVGLQNAVARGQSIENAMQSLILAGYNAQEVQEASKQINMGIISHIAPEKTIEENPSAYKKLPTENVQQNIIPEENKKTKFPRWAVVTTIISSLIILGIIILGFLGPKILEAIK